MAGPGGQTGLWKAELVMTHITCVLDGCKWVSRESSALHTLISHLVLDHDLTEAGAKHAISTGGQVPAWAQDTTSSGARSFLRRTRQSTRANRPAPVIRTAGAAAGA